MSIPIRKKRIRRLSESMAYIFSLDLKQKEAIADEIFKKQPQLLFEAIGLHYQNVPLAKMEHVINVLLVFYDYFTERGDIRLPMVTERMIDEARANIASMLRLLDSEGPENGWPLMKKGVEAYPEVEALAFYTGYMREHGFTENSKENECCVRAAKVILDCFLKVTTGKKQGPRQQQKKK